MNHDFIRSGRTISKHFHSVLKAVLRLSLILLARPLPVDDECQDSRWRWIKGCLGALDGTLIEVRVPDSDKERYRNRKGQISTNILGLCNLEGMFTYVLSGWEGSAADGRVLRDVVHRPADGKVPTGNYYLCDNGYGNVEGFHTPYRGVRFLIIMGTKSNRHAFFKFFSPETSANQLEIPSAFTLSIQGALPNKAILRDQYNNSWQVNVAKVGDTFYLTDGWAKFVGDNFITGGDMLVFECYGEGLFDTKIYDSSGFEKKGVGAFRVTNEETKAVTEEGGRTNSTMKGKKGRRRI
ncbi:UNVERIFIED_CONTAM: hypothetical protein Scaly_0578800 [Sesamum calycinum]|uniref:TF-B3 domain-containing protein n=1 Tax=Sesamum calycinum TaxID=2727403 RepID=A0AAW2RRZ4_9LAMI